MFTSGRGAKIFFRTAFNVLVISVIAFTGLVIGGFYFVNTISLVEKLSDDLFEEISRRPMELAAMYMENAGAVSELNKRLAGQGLLDVEDYPRLADHFIQVLQAHPQLTITAYGDEQGSSILVYRTVGGAFEVHAWHPVGPDRTRFSRFLVSEDHSWDPDLPLHTELQSGGRRFDPRQRPWYVRPAQRGAAAWTDPYIWSPQEVPGITYGNPLFDVDDQLIGVFTVDFELGFLSEFMRELSFREQGQVFVIDAEGRLIAHPVPQQTVERQGSISDIAHASGSSDPIVRGAYRMMSSTSGDAGITFSGKLQDTFVVNGQRQVLVSRALPISRDVVWYITLVVPENEVLGEVYRSIRITLLLCLLILAVSLVMGLLLGNRIKQPLRYMFEEIERMGNLEIGAKQPVRSFIREIDLMGDALERTKSSLRSFEKYVPSDLVRRLQERGVEARLGGRSAELTVFFCDLINFTALSETKPPEELVEILGIFFSEMSGIIRACNGTVDKFIGDEVMAFWGAPADIEDHALQACTAALECRSRLDQLQREYPEIKYRARFGLNTGVVMVGNMGAHERMNYTVVGDSVNVASRLEGLNKVYHTDIIISERTKDLVQDQIDVRHIDRVAIRGRSKGIEIYQPLARRGETAEGILRLRDRYAAAFELYQRRDWHGASEGFHACLKIDPSDGPSSVLAKRCDEFLFNGPPDDWDGTFHPVRR